MFMPREKNAKMATDNARLYFSYWSRPCLHFGQNRLDFENLYSDQKSALKEITSFIKSDEEQIFILQGTSLSGKTHLIPLI